MVKNYFTVAVRNILRQKGYSFINIAGLAVGITCFILIMLWVQNELSFDKFNANYDRICLLGMDANIGGSLLTPVTSMPMGPALKQEYPEVEEYCRLTNPRRVSVEYKDHLYYEDNVSAAENSLFKIFSFPFIEGDEKNALTAPGTVVLTETMAKKYFGKESPIGKVLKLNGKKDYTVTGVIRDVPQNSHFRFNIVYSFQTILNDNPQEAEAWMNISVYTYLLLTKGTDYIAFENKLTDFVDRHLGVMLKAMGGSIKMILQPMKDIYLHSDFPHGIGVQSNITYVYLFSGVAVLVLIIACVNFINLTTARSMTRAKEIGIRKTFGADRGRLVNQFLGEAVFLSFVSMLLAVFLIEIILPWFNNLTGRVLSLDMLKHPEMALWFLGTAILTGLLSGLYPAFYLSSFQPILAIRSGISVRRSSSTFRRILVVGQFVISIVLIVGALVIYGQNHYIKNKDLGFDKNQVVIIPRMTEAMKTNFSSFRNEILSVPGVIDAGASDVIPSRGRLMTLIRPEGFSSDQLQTLDYMNTDADYLKTMKMHLAAGSYFPQAIPGDTTKRVIINEAAMRKLDWKEPLGKKFYLDLTDSVGGPSLVYEVIGVVKDFHTETFHRAIEPRIIFNDISSTGLLSVRISTDNTDKTLEGLKAKWKQYDSNRPFDYFFLDESFDAMFKTEQLLGKIVLYFSILAVFIGCLGLLGMAAYSAERRTKEIGVRKVLGASVGSVVVLVCREFLYLTLIANVIALPLAYYIMSKWMQSFVYHTKLEWWMFGYAGCAAIFLAVATVSYTSMRAATANPIKSLRYE